MTQMLKLLGLCALVACADDQWDDCITSTGPTVQQEREVSDFHTIELGAKVDVLLTQDSVNSIVVEGGRNLLGQTETSISGGVLTINSNMTCNWVRNLEQRVTVHVHCKELRQVTFTGSGDVRCKNMLNVPTFRVEQRQGSGTLNLNVTADTIWYGLHTGPGNVVATGSADVLYLYSSGYGHIDARNQPSRESHCNNSGSGDFRTAPTDVLYAAVRDAGDIHYYSTPTFGVFIEDTGSGSVVQGD